MTNRRKFLTLLAGIPVIGAALGSRGASGTMKIVSTQVFTTSGSYTPITTKTYIVECVGGGGGGLSYIIIGKDGTGGTGGTAK